jgi:hypothetical protein
MVFAIPPTTIGLAEQEGEAMGFFFEVNVDEFIELMECETEARRRVAEIIERRRRSQSRSFAERDDDQGTH